MEMNLILPSAFAGVIAAVTATAILGVAKWIHQWWLRSQDVEYLRDVLIQGRKRVLEAKDTYNERMDAWFKADALRAAQYDNMLKELDVALEKWLPNLSNAQRKDLYDALDWYHIGKLQVIKKDGEAVFTEFPDGKWPTTEMPIEMAERKFEKLQSIKWLQLKAE